MWLQSPEVTADRAEHPECEEAPQQGRLVVALPAVHACLSSKAPASCPNDRYMSSSLKSSRAETFRSTVLLGLQEITEHEAPPRAFMTFCVFYCDRELQSERAAGFMRLSVKELFTFISSTKLLCMRVMMFDAL